MVYSESEGTQKSTTTLTLSMHLRHQNSNQHQTCPPNFAITLWSISRIECGRVMRGLCGYEEAIVATRGEWYLAQAPGWLWEADPIPKLIYENAAKHSGASYQSKWAWVVLNTRSRMSCCDRLPPDLAGQTADKQDEKNRRVHGIMQRAVQFRVLKVRLSIYLQWLLCLVPLQVYWKSNFQYSKLYIC